MTPLSRIAALGLFAMTAPSAQAALPDPVRAMIDAAIASDKESDIETVAALARATNPDDVAEADALVAAWRAQRSTRSSASHSTRHIASVTSRT